jgi:hypothetical protein
MIPLLLLAQLQLALLPLLPLPLCLLQHQLCHGAEQLPQLKGRRLAPAVNHKRQLLVKHAAELLLRGRHKHAGELACRHCLVQLLQRRALLCGQCCAPG